MSRYKQYPAYKDSGVEWLGEVPVHWEVKRLKTVVAGSIQNGLFKRKDAFGSGTPLVNVSDIYTDRLIVDEEALECVETSVDERAKFAVSGGDIFFVRSSLKLEGVGRSACIAEPARETVFECHLVRTRPDRKIVRPDVLVHLLNSCLVIQRLVSLANTVTMSTLPQTAISSLDLPIAPLPEQQSIAAFLDRETGKIDALVAKKQRLIELLQEKRTALITHAVTKGLDPTVPMKDSGVEWLGEVPAGWEVTQLGRNIQLQRGVDITKDAQTEGTVPVVSSGGIASFHNVAYATGPGVLVGRKGSAGTVHWVEVDYWPHDTTLWVREFRGNSRRYVYYKLLSMDLAAFDTGSANPTVNRNIVHPVHVSWPPLSEQQSIAAYLDRETSKIDALISKVREAIDRLKEYRTALISDAVTGKIDVRDAA